MVINIQKFLLSFGILLFLSNLCFGSSFSLYNEDSPKSKIIAIVDQENQDEYIRFYTREDGKWAKFANTKTGKVGWVDLTRIKAEKADALRIEILNSLQDQIQHYKDKITALSEMKKKNQ